jgi:phospholipase C
MTTASTPIKHVVIIIKENHSFDNYFGTFPGAEGVQLAHAPNPPKSDHPHDHLTWENRNHNPVKQQYLESDIPAYFAYARQYTLCDHYFTAVAGPSTPNHLALVTADSVLINNPKSSAKEQYTLSNLPDLLVKHNLTWTNYGHYIFQYIVGLANSPFNLTSADFATQARAGKLPAVSWVYTETDDEHPPKNITPGVQWTVDQIQAVVDGGLWGSTAIFVTWDDWGGWYDHVTPPNVRTWEPSIAQYPAEAHPEFAGQQFFYGSRVPCLVISPFAKQGFISKAQHSHISLVKFCETNFGLPPLNANDGSANESDMMDCFDFNNSLPPPVV